VTRAGPHRRPSYRDLLAIANLPALLLAAALSRLAARMLSLAIVLYALARFGSPALAGWLSCAMIAPGLAATPLSGALLDRIGAIRAIAIDMAASAVIILVLVAADRIGWATPAVLLTLVALLSLTIPLGTAGIRTLLPRLVPEAARDRANALDTAIFAATDVIGPALAGLLTGALAPTAALTLIALAYGAGAGCVLRIRVPHGRAGRGSLLGEARAGLRLVLREPTIRALGLSYSCYVATWGMLLVAVPVYATGRFGAGGDLAAGLLFAAAGLAGGIGALVAGQLRTAGRERAVMAFGMIATALAAWPIAALGLPGLVVGLIIVGIAAGPIDVGLLTLRQRRTDPASLGRVLAVSFGLNSLGLPAGAALAGMLVAWSPAATLAAAALAAATGALASRLIPAQETR
jgi:predicted MFS family arabinose efflux permease